MEHVECKAYGKLPDLLTARQAAAILNVHPRTVTRLCAAGKLKAVKVASDWRVNKGALLDYAGLEG